MRRFIDRDGTAWDVMLGRESWGTLLALFVPVAATAAARQTALEASAYEVATQELNALDDSGLQRLLDRSTLKEGGT